MKIDFNTSDFSRKVSDAASLILKNRYFEKNPSLSETGAALIARPGMRMLTSVGQGPIRGLFSEAGSFNGDLFAVSYDSLYRIKNDLTNTLIGSGLYRPLRGVVNMAITAKIEDVPEYLFLADGQELYVYIENGYSTGTLVGTPANNDVVRTDQTYYRFTTGSVNAGTPAGTSANPWLVLVGVNQAESIQNLADAINNTGVGGVQYSSALSQNPSVQTISNNGTSVTIRAKLIGTLGNSIITTETGAALSWTNGGTLTGGGNPYFAAVELPDNVGAIDVAVINSFVIVIPVQSGKDIGKFYWIEPGEIIINPLNFATAERSPDGINGVEVVGDQYWLPGESTTEVWYVSGDATAPMQRQRGIVYDRGTWADTAKSVKENLVIVDADGGVFLIQGGSPQRMSTPSIEEQIRMAISDQQGSLYPA